jgi:outer membrane lipoprotein-sorting protein
MKIILSFIIVLTISFQLSAQNKAQSYIDNMQKKFKSFNAFSANFTYSNDGGNSMSGSITVKGNKFRLKTSGQEIFNNGKEVATYIKEINEVNISNFDPAEGDLSPAKIYSFDKKAYKANLVSEVGNLAIVELTPTAKNGQVQKITLRLDKTSNEVKEWTIQNKNGKKQNFKVTKLNSKISAEDKTFNFDKKLFPGVEINDLR